MRALEEVKKTNPEAEIKKYRKNLLEITHFKATEYRPRRWLSEETKNISLESEERSKNPQAQDAYRHRDAKGEDTQAL